MVHPGATRTTVEHDLSLVVQCSMLLLFIIIILPPPVLHPVHRPLLAQLRHTESGGTGVICHVHGTWLHAHTSRVVRSREESHRLEQLPPRLVPIGQTVELVLLLSPVYHVPDTGASHCVVHIVECATVETTGGVLYGAHVTGDTTTRTTAAEPWQ